MKWCKRCGCREGDLNPHNGKCEPMPPLQDDDECEASCSDRKEAMNYEANTMRWKVGDLVIHDADAKRTEMLMVVLGYAKDGRCRTRYATGNALNGDERRRKPAIWENPISHLHDPARFGISVDTRPATEK